MSKGIDISKFKAQKPGPMRRMADSPKTPIQGQIGRKVSPASWLGKDYALFPSFGDKQKESFYHELYILLDAGIDLKSAFDMLIEQQRDPHNTRILCQLQDSVVGGNTLSSAMQHSTTFTPYEYHSIQIGEETGKLSWVLTDLAIYFRNRLKQKRQIKSAMTYPCIVLLTSFGAIGFMMAFIVPLFADIFQRSGSSLPKVTQLIVSASDFSRVYGPYLLLFLSLFVLWLYLRRDNETHRKWTASIALKLPIFGGIIRKVYLARFCNSMALLTGAKIPLIRALELCRQMVGFYPIERSLARVENDILLGKALHQSLSTFPIYDNKLLSLVKVGEEVNQLSVFFGKIASQYNDEVEYQSASISALLEPLIIIFLGFFVGLILIAMYLPMLQMGEVFG